MPTLKYGLSVDAPIAVADYASVTYTTSTALVHTEATGTTDTALSMGDVTTADVVYIKSDKALTLNINVNTGTDIPLDANQPFFMGGTAITALYISNASGSTANVTYFLAGA